MLNQDGHSSSHAGIDLLLVEDHPYVRKLLRELIETYEDLRIVGEASTGEEAVLLALKLKPAVLVMDVHLPVLSGPEATMLIKRDNPFTAVIGLTAGDPNQDAKAMTTAGAAAVIYKGDLLNALHPAIIEALKQVKLVPSNG
jgi:DNA-binding NarL/FixJ family response regulator